MSVWGSRLESWTKAALCFSDSVHNFLWTGDPFWWLQDRVSVGFISDAAALTISSSKSKTFVFNRKRVQCLIRVRDEVLSQVEELKYLEALFTDEGKMELVIDRRIGAACRHCSDLYLPVGLHSYSQRWLQTLNSDWKNEILHSKKTKSWLNLKQ